MSYTANAVLSCVELALSPKDHTKSVRERVTYTRSEFTRDVRLSLVPPVFPAGLGDGLDDEEDAAEEVLLFPILTPRRGSLLTVTDCEDGEGNRLTRLSHEEHEELSRLMISELLWLSGAIWLTVDYDNARAGLLKLQEDLWKIPTMEPEQAEKLLFGDGRNANSGIFNSVGQIRVIPLTIRMVQESSLHLLCRLLCRRYLLVLEGVGRAGEKVQVKYRHLTPAGRYRAKGLNGLVEHLGGAPSNLKVPVPLARRTNDYHFFLGADPGYYIAWQEAFTVPVPDVASTGLQTAGDVSVEHVSALGSVSQAHVYISGGSTLRQHRVNINVTSYESPLGSTAASITVAAMGTVLMFLILVARAVSGGALTGSDVPALVSALFTTAAAVAGASFQGRLTGSPSVSSRLSILMSTILGMGFAVWLLLAFASSSVDDNSVPGAVVKWIGEWGGLAIFAVSVALLALQVRRGIRMVQDFRRVVTLAEVR